MSLSKLGQSVGGVNYFLVPFELEAELGGVRGSEFGLRPK